jgi:hypothetical protein
MPHVLLNGTFREVNAQLEEFAADPLCSPEAILRCHVLDQRHSLCRDLWLGRGCSGLVFPVQLESLAMPPQERLRLNNEKGLLPCTRRSSEQDQDQPIRLCACWSFDLPTEDDELLPEKGVCCHELGLASGEVSHGSHYERGGGWFGPVDEAVVERLKAGTASLDGG